MNKNELKACNMNEPYIFISYSSMDSDLVWEDVRELQSRGYNIWIDEKNLDKKKESWKQDALEAIKKMKCKLVVFYVSENSLTSEACYNELKKTMDEDTKKLHKRKAIPFIAVEVERIKDIMEWADELAEKIEAENENKKENEKLKEEEVEKKVSTLYTFIEEFFNSNNERVRIHAKDTQKRLEEYYRDIIDNIPEECYKKSNDAVPGEAKEAEIEEKPEPIQDQEDTVPTVSGDITYSLYGEAFTENQSDMMLRFFAQVLKRHQDIVAELPEYKGMNCVSKVNCTILPKEERECYFRTCHWFTFENDEAICVGTSYSLADKLKKMALLLDITGEDASVFCSEQVELPVIKTKTEKGSSNKKGNGAELSFEVFGKSYTASQVDMLGIIFSTFVERYPERLRDIADACTCLDIVDYSLVDKEDRPCYFKSSYNVYEINGVKYSVGGGFSLKEKIRMIGILVSLCEEEAESVKIEGEAIEVKKSSGRTVKQNKQFL